MVKPDGNTRDHYVFDEYGKPAPGNSKQSEDGRINLNNTFGYTGEQWDEETNLLYLRARYYEPETGRFLSRDSFGGYDTDPLSLNRYTYVQNNPMNFVDPTGNLPLKLGSKNNNVQQTFDVQYWLTSLKYTINQSELMPGGTYGQSTASAVHRFQKDHGLAHDSIVGEKTYNRLKKIIENGGVDPYPVKPSKLQKVVKNGNHYNDQGTRQINKVNPAPTKTNANPLGLTKEQIKEMQENAMWSALGPVSLVEGAGKVVIGENMAGRVIPYAEEIGAKYYKPTSKIAANWMKNNERWIREQVKRGREIIDIGIDAARDVRSKYYEMEKRVLEELGYPVTKP